MMLSLVCLGTRLGTRLASRAVDIPLPGLGRHVISEMCQSGNNGGRGEGGCSECFVVFGGKKGGKLSVKRPKNATFGQ